MALKNSSYQLLISLFMKIGSLIFTVIMARILLPEKMGLYSLALSTIVFFSAFSDLGIGNALLAYIPYHLSKKEESKAKGYFILLFKWKILVLTLISVLLFVLSKYISNNYYNKPILFALFAGSIYLFLSGIVGFYEQAFRALNNFKPALIKEIIFQFLRIFLVPIMTLFLLYKNLNSQILIFFIFLFLSFCYLIGFIYLLFISKKSSFFSKKNISFLTKEEIKELKNFLSPLILTSLSGVFFGYIDIIMLGHYVTSEFISYYTSAFSLITSLGVIISFISSGIFPLLSSTSGKKLEDLFKKAIKYSLIIAIFSFIFILIFASPIIKLIYGEEYIQSIPILRYYSIIILIFPLTSLYENFFISQKKTRFFSKVLIVSTIINVILNFLFIKYGVSHFGYFEGVLGACFATVISKVVYFISLVLKKKISNH